jgi:hypothetical protein
MRRVSHAELSDCQRSPRQWVQSKVLPGGAHPVFGYRQALINAIFRFHKANSLDEAEAALRAALSRFQDAERIEEILEQFSTYIDWVEQSGIVVADSRIVVDAPFGNRLHMGGIVSRLDVTDSGYRAVLLQTPSARWRQELRFPLIQAAIALKFSRDVRRVEVGVQEDDGSELQVHRYSERDISTARSEFREIETAVAAVAGQLPGGLAWLDRTR